MANYYCSCRSSYFKVRDANKFLAWANAIVIQLDSPRLFISERNRY